MSRIVIVGTMVAVLALLAGATGCEKSPESKPAGTPADKPSAAADGNAKSAAPDASLVPAEVWLASEPADAKPLAEVKKDAKEGDSVVVFGRIGGQPKPFIDGRAMFILADRSIQSCVERHGPGCKTPWDFCCESKETLLANIATIEVVGADGKVLKTGLDGVHGLKPLSEIAVVGKIATAGESLVIDAKGIYVKPTTQ